MVKENQHNLIFKHGIRSQKIHCPKCHGDRTNKSDKSLSIDTEKGVFKCHHCDWSGRIDGWMPDLQNYEKPKRSGWSALGDAAGVFLKSRGFSIETVKKNKLIQKRFGQEDFIGYPFFIPTEVEPINIKWRSVEGKQFRQEAKTYRVLYNITLWGDAEELIWVEGENDVIALNECGFWNVTTLSDGAINEKDEKIDGKLTSLHNSFEYIKHFKSHIIATDDDPSGRRLKEELIKILGPSKCKTVEWGEELKDANKALLTHGKEKVISTIGNAKKVPVSGVLRLSDRLPQMLESFRNGKPIGEQTYFGDFDNLFRWKKGQSNLWTGYANTGKSTFLNQLILTKSLLDEWKWAVFSPENYPADDFYDDLIEMYVGKHVSDFYSNKMSEAEYLEACRFIDTHIVFIYPEENHSIESLHERFESLILEFGIDGVIVDPYNQIEKMGGATIEMEVSNFMKAANRFAKFHNIVYNIVIHPKNISLPKGEDFKAADMKDLSGGAMWGNMAFDIISVHRPNWFVDRTDNKVVVVTQKIKRKRTGGQQGEVTFYHDFMRARYSSEPLTSPTRKYFCDPDRRADKEQIRMWEQEKEVTAVKENTAFIATSSQDIKENESPYENDPLMP
jgi:twinkle protein